MKWLVLSGSNRPGSMTRRFSGFVYSELSQRVGTDKVDLMDLIELPLEIFHPESYAQKPPSFESFEKRFIEADAVLTILPEYNGAAPGVFKYFLDMLPFPQSLYKIPCFFYGVSAGRFGAVRSVEQSQQVFQYRNALIYPENIFIPAVDRNITDSGEPTDAFVRKLFDQTMDGFIAFARGCQSLRNRSSSD